MSLFSKNLRFLRKKENLNQDQVCVLFNKKANTIGNWENQKSEPSLAELMKLAEYFKVSMQELLYVDMEVKSLAGKAVGKETPKEGQSPKLYSIPEPATSMVGESNPDAFWIILRELRALNDKVDLLILGMETTGFKRNSDKSYH